MLDDFTTEPRVAYFSMEIALDDALPTYAGGLGVLAGDTLRSACDLNVPLVAVTLVSRKGYFNQEITRDGRQIEYVQLWDPEQHATALPAKVSVEIEGRRVWIGGWLYEMAGHMGGSQPVLLLDTDLSDNDLPDRELTDFLYGGDTHYRLLQEIVLGIGGVRMLDALGFAIKQYHMNEGHAALLGLELLHRRRFSADDVRPGESSYDLPRVRDLCCFTTHTPVEAGHDHYPYDLVERVMGEQFDGQLVKRLAGDDTLNMTRLALNVSDYVNGVAKRHAEVSRALFPGYTVHAITNGVHPFTWAAGPFRELYDQYLPGWCHEPELLVRAECCIPDEAVDAAHRQCKETLVAEILHRTGIALDPGVPIIGAARRVTAYKRPALLFSDPERLRKIATKTPFQLVLAGKAHPADADGKRLIERLHREITEFAPDLRVVFVPDYGLALARLLVAGVDTWLNTPMKPLEASGTSGMKAAFNGVPNLSVLDGWWVEGCIEGVTGWAIGDESADTDHDVDSLYDKLEHIVLPMLTCSDRTTLIRLMKGAISKNASFFNSHRMMRRYAAEAYQ